MGIEERKAKHRDGLRRKILAAAEEVFVADGYRNVSMREIARRIEYSPTTIYRLFKNKDEIMEELIAQGYVGVYQRYQEIIAREGDDPLATLEEIIRSYIEFALANPRHYELWFATSRIEVVDAQLHMHHGNARYKVYHVWLDHIEECQRRGLLADTDTLTLFQLIWAAVHGVISLRLHHPGFPWLPLQSHIDSLIAMIEGGLCLTPGTPGSATRTARDRKD
jgi:AcrR family transcriptional regulator